MRRWTLHIALALVAFPFPGAGAGTRIKDLTMIAGARDNQLVGYGLVAGLAGEGDRDRAGPDRCRDGGST